jgi:uncharacterized protein (TIGR03437 family)
VVHSTPFGNWGVTSNYGQKGNSRQFDGWCHDARICDNSGSCRSACTDGWFEWNSCTVSPFFTAPNCTLYNAAGCTEQQTTLGINVHGTKTVDVPVRCPIDTNGDGIADQGGCRDVREHTTGTNFLSLYELDPVCCDELVQTVYFPSATIPLTCDTLGCASNASQWLTPVAWDSPATPAKVFAEVSALVNWGAFVDDRRACGVATPEFRVVSAASYVGPGVATESIATAFGDQLSPATGEAALLPLPTSLAGFTLTITDSRGIERPAPLFYISPGQVNFLLPAGVALGQARVAIFNGPVLRSTARIQVDAIAPALFTRDASGKGLAAGTTVLVGDTVYVTLYGTGIRNRTALSAVSATIGGVNARVDFAGAQGQFVGLDQVNLAVPREVAGRGAVDVILTVGSRAANPVQVILP